MAQAGGSYNNPLKKFKYVAIGREFHVGHVTLMLTCRLVFLGEQSGTLAAEVDGSGICGY